MMCEQGKGEDAVQEPTLGSQPVGSCACCDWPVSCCIAVSRYQTAGGHHIPLLSCLGCNPLVC